ncbi:MAG TPA: hypothetical protein VFA38_11715 [Nitrospirales bacterium]|nr:hypothetical protein [Nitrospirales bacterium]
MTRLILAFMLTICGVLSPAIGRAEDRAIYSPLIHVNPEKGFIIVSADGKVFAVEASPAAKPHLSKLPPSGMIDIVVELREKDQPPLLKKWKLASGESSCKVFDGSACK